MMLPRAHRETNQYLVVRGSVPLMLNAQEIATRYRRKIGIDTTWEKVENENGKRINDADVRRGNRPTS
jgi:hypothetical protein